MSPDVSDDNFAFDKLLAWYDEKRNMNRRVLRYHHIHLSDAYAIGDSMNDIPMLEAVPNSIAVGESPEKLKQLSSFVTKNLLDDGIEYALRYSI